MARIRRRSALGNISRTVAPGVRVLGLLAVVCLVSAGVILGPSLLRGAPAPVATAPAASPVALEPDPAPAAGERPGVEYENGLPVIETSPLGRTPDPPPAGPVSSPPPARAPAARQPDQPPAAVASEPVRRTAPEPVEADPLVPQPIEPASPVVASPAAQPAPARQAPAAATPVEHDVEAANSTGYRRELRVLAAKRLNGEDVRRVQIRLMTLAGEDPSRGGDGWYGPRTATGVRQFQARNGLPVTGVVDRRTWDALFAQGAR